MGRPVVHFEIGCKDSAKTQEFYKELFDWKIEAMGPAAMIAAEAGGITGHITVPGTTRITTRFLCGGGRCGRISGKSEITRRQDACSSSRDSDRDVCVVAGSRGPHRWAAEDKKIEWNSCRRPPRSRQELP